MEELASIVLVCLTLILVSPVCVHCHVITIYSVTDPFDFTSLTTSMTFFGASPLRCENISITADQVVEVTEDFTIKLATGDTAVILTNSSADVLIWDTSGSNIASIPLVPKKWL